MQYELGIIGAGNMAEAIVRGALGAKVFEARQLVAADVSPVRREVFTAQLGVRCVEDVADVAARCRTLLLSVKPHQVTDLLRSLGRILNPETLILSIAAGISTSAMHDALADSGDAANKNAWRIIRAMPNTPMLVGKGMVALCAGTSASDADMKLATRILGASARVVTVTEDKMDAVTAVSGSGPAYFFYLVEAMVAAGQSLGLDEATASILAKQTALGAAELLVNSSETPSELRRRVTTPGGTTAAAIGTFESAKMSQTIMDALRAAARRSAEMGR